MLKRTTFIFIAFSMIVSCSRSFYIYSNNDQRLLTFYSKTFFGKKMFVSKCIVQIKFVNRINENAVAYINAKDKCVDVDRINIYMEDVRFNYIGIGRLRNLKKYYIEAISEDGFGITESDIIAK